MQIFFVAALSHARGSMTKIAYTLKVWAETSGASLLQPDIGCKLWDSRKSMERHPCQFCALQQLWV